MKPEWCPKDVWSHTAVEFHNLYENEPDLEGGCEQAIREMLSINILAARQEGRKAGLEEAAKIAGVSGIRLKRDIVAAIRKAGEE